MELISNKKKIFSQLTKDSFKPTIKQRQTNDDEKFLKKLKEI